MKPLDCRALVEGAKAHRVALEVNNRSLRASSFRVGCRENYEKLLPLCMEYQVPIFVNSDAHDPLTVGNFTLAAELLDRIGFDDALILNNDLQKTKGFLLEQN